MTITQLTYILAVDDFRHFGKAADKCHVTQPTLSIQLQKLEEELGIIIFDRSKTPITPTAIGEKIIRQARIIVKESERINDIVSNQGNEVGGTFKMAVIPTVAPYVIPLFLREFHDKYPDVKLSIEEMKTVDIIAALEKDSIDGALLATPLKNDQIIERVLFYEPFYAYVSEDSELYKAKSISEKEIDPNVLWLLHEGHCFRDQALNICQKKRGKKIGSTHTSDIHFESGNLDTLRKLVDKYGGHTLLPYLATNDLNPEQKKKQLKSFKDPMPTREISLVHSRIFLKEHIINALEATILECLPKELKRIKGTSGQVIEFAV